MHRGLESSSNNENELGLTFYFITSLLVPNCSLNGVCVVSMHNPGLEHNENELGLPFDFIASLLAPNCSPNGVCMGSMYNPGRVLCIRTTLGLEPTPFLIFHGPTVAYCSKFRR